LFDYLSNLYFGKIKGLRLDLNENDDSKANGSSMKDYVLAELKALLHEQVGGWNGKKVIEKVKQEIKKVDPPASQEPGEGSEDEEEEPPISDDDEDKITTLLW